MGVPLMWSTTVQHTDICVLYPDLFVPADLRLKRRHWQTDSLTSTELSIEIHESQVCHLTKQQTDGA